MLPRLQLALLALPALGAALILARRRRRRSDIVVIKLGGSAITQKAKFETVNDAALRKTASALAATSSAVRHVLVHGAGSFGHFQAREYGVSRGRTADSFSWRGFAETRSSVCKLNGLVVAALLAESVAAVGCPPFPRWITSAKRVLTSAVADLTPLLASGLTPVLHGDADPNQAKCPLAP